MMRSLYAGVAGLKTHQTRMDVIGNNIANVNTTAYKSQSMTFSDLMYQTTQSASGANATTGVGGVNARQIGLGAKTGAIKTAISGQGASQTTNDPFDIMITGDAFFVVSNGADNFFTRDGSFYVDGKGNLAMTSNGYNVMGWQAVEDETGKLAIKEDTVSALRIMTDVNMTYPPEETSKATVSGIVDAKDNDVNAPSGKIMNLEIYDRQGYKYTARFSVHSVNGDGTKGDFYVKMDDLLDVDGKSILTDANRAGVTFGSGATELTDNSTTAAAITGATNSAYLKFVEGQGTFDYVSTTGLETDDTFENKVATITFDQDAFPQFANIDIDFSATSNYNNNKASTINAVAGDSANAGAGSGRKIGEMSGIAIQKDGMIYASYDNGQSRLLGQIATASFANASGLAKEGDNLYSATQNSGDFDGIGSDITVGGGYMNTGVLEMSNVDLSAEFTEMITTQRGFQANSRIITVSDTLLEELTNLKR